MNQKWMFPFVIYNYRDDQYFRIQLASSEVEAQRIVKSEAYPFGIKKITPIRIEDIPSGRVLTYIKGRDIYDRKSKGNPTLILSL